MPAVPPQGQQDQQHDTRSNQYYGDVEKKEKKDKKSGGHGAVIGGAAAGIAVGALGGALIANAMGKLMEYIEEFSLAILTSAFLQIAIRTTRRNTLLLALPLPQLPQLPPPHTAMTPRLNLRATATEPLLKTLHTATELLPQLQTLEHMADLPTSQVCTMTLLCLKRLAQAALCQVAISKTSKRSVRLSGRHRKSMKKHMRRHTTIETCRKG